MRYWFLLAVVIVLTACNSESVEQEEATVSPREQTAEENYYLPMILDQHVLFSAEDLPADTKEIALSYEVWENGSIVDDLTRSIAIGLSEDRSIGDYDDVMLAFNDLETGIDREIELMIRTMDEEKVGGTYKGTASFTGTEEGLGAAVAEEIVIGERSPLFVNFTSSQMNSNWYEEEGLQEMIQANEYVFIVYVEIVV
ncbi:hypothetical protein DH09_16250 [Bacillaceae bacterium JMAK1]|nr:hypothetical protein DH09_16250 [Bacillaceae bacterium JMAK1]